MARLLDKFNQPDQYNSYSNLWYLRVALDVYAIATDVPLRIYHRDRLQQFYDDAIQVNENFKNQFPDKATFDHQVSQWAQQSPVEIYRKFKELDITEVSRQLTVKYGDHRYFYQSNEHPLLRLFAEYQTWQWWEFCVFYDLFVIKQPLADPQQIDWGFNDKIHLCYIWVENMQSFVVAGPVWKLETAKGKRTGESFEKDVVTPIVDQFIETIKAVRGDDLSPKRERLIRLGNSRFEVSALNLSSYLTYVADALQMFTGIQVAENFELISLHRSDYVKLAEWALFLAKTVNMVKEFYLPNCSENSPPPPVCQQQPFYYFTRTYDGKTDKFRVKTDFTFDPVLQKITPHLELSCNSKEFEPINLISDTYIKTTSPSPFLEKLGISFSRFLHDVLTKQNSARAEYLSYLRTWLDDRFGTLTTEENEENNGLTNESRLENQLARRISWFLHADITTLYRYDYGQEYLETIGVYCSTAQRDEWVKCVPNQMKSNDVYKNTENRKKSICYRCVDTEQIRFCRSFDPNNSTKTEPLGEALLPPPSHLISHKSGLVVPILVHNRVWGVMEILGTRPHQFRWDDRRFTSELSETLSTFFYHQWLLSKLQQLSKIAVQEKETPAGYDKICRYLAELLMSYGAAIWIYESQGGGYYKCKGVYQREWNQKPSLRDEKIYLSDKDAVIIYTRDEIRQHPEKIWWEKHIEELPSHWQELDRNKPLLDGHIKTIACIPIYSSQPQESRETIAYIVLYNKAGHHYDDALQATERLKKYDDRWKPYFGFVARYTAIVLEAIQAQTAWERRSRRFVRHEIKSNVNQISDRVSELKRIYRKDFQEHHPNISKEFLKRYDILISDLEIYARYLQSNLEYLSEGNFAKYLRSASPIAARIQYKIAAGEQPIWLELRQAFNVSFRAAWILQRKKQLVAVYPHYKPTFIRIHEDSLHHVLGNLCDNAIKYASEGSTIKIEEVEIDGSMEWSISNVGECLGKNEEYRIFEEGVRGSNAKHESGEGKGLFIVRDICELYGVAIHYDSEVVKEGCVHKFTLSFPPQMVKITRGGHS